VIGSDTLSQDTRFWEVFNEKDESLGIFMYGNIIEHYTGPFNRTIGNARSYMETIGHKMKVIGDIMPLEADSDIPEIQAKKLHYRRLERRKAKKYAQKYGFKITSIVKFGKYKGLTIKEIIEKDLDYWVWFSTRPNIILHPDLDKFKITPVEIKIEWKNLKDVLKS